MFVSRSCTGGSLGAKGTISVVKLSAAPFTAPPFPPRATSYMLRGRQCLRERAETTPLHVILGTNARPPIRAVCYAPRLCRSCVYTADRAPGEKSKHEPVDYKATARFCSPQAESGRTITTVAQTHLVSDAHPSPRCTAVPHRAVPGRRCSPVPRASAS